MPARQFIITSIFVFSSTVFAQEPTASEVTSEPLPISEVKEVAPQTTAPAVQAEPVAQAPAPPPPVDPKVEAMQKQIEEMQKQLKTLSTPKTETQLPVQPHPPTVPPSSAAKAAAIPVTTPPVEPQALRKRDFSLGWLYNSTVSETDISQGSSSGSGESKRVEIQIEFARNFSRFEFGVTLGNIYREIEEENVNTTIFGALARINFIENIPSNNFIPYFAGYLVLAGQEFNSTTATEYEISGNGLGAGFGFNWFPFGEIFALNAELRQLRGDLDNNATPKLKVEEEQTSLQLGWRIYF